MSMNKRSNLLNMATALLVVTMLVSCYKFGRIAAPKEVNPHEAYDGRIVVVNDNNNGPVNTYGIFAVRIPVNWDVTVGEDAYVQYADGDIYIPADENDPDNKPGGPANVTDGMHYSALLSSFYNQSNPKDGYTWVAFVTNEKHRAGLQGSGSNSCDSVAFNYKVINDGVAGRYELDYIIGDEEENVNRFNSVQDALGTRVYCTSTESSTLPKNDNGEEAFDHVQTEFKTTIVVLEGGGEPTVHKPTVTVSNENPKAGESVVVNYKDMASGANISIYRATDIVPQKQACAVEGDGRFNEGSFTLTDLQPGVYHVRATDISGNYIVGQQEGTIRVAYPEVTEGDYNFIVMSDLNLLNSDELVEGDVPETASYASYVQSPLIMNLAMSQIIQQKPKALFITGNLTMAGELKSHEMVAGQLAAVEKMGIKVYVIPGSTDVNNPEAKSYNGESEKYAENITADDFARIYADYGYSEAVERDEHSLSYVIYPTDNLAVICLDDNRYNENQRVGEEPSDDDVLVTEGRITKETLEWMQGVVAKAAGRKVIVMMNHLVAAPFNGYDVLGSLVNKEAADLGSFFGGGDEDTEAAEPYEVTNDDIQQAFINMGIWAVFCGDLQCSDIQKVYVDGSDYNFFQVATESMRSAFSAYRYVTVNGSDLTIVTRPLYDSEDDIYDADETDRQSFLSAEEYLVAAAPVTVARICEENWDVIDPIFKENFTFDYDPDVDIFNKNDFMRLPESPEDLANRVNNTLTQPILNIITAFHEGNEQQKDSQKLVDDVKAGFDAFFDSLNTFPSIITPMIKEGFAAAGLDTDALAESIVGSLAYNYVGSTDNVTDDLFVTLPYSGKPTSVRSIAAEKDAAAPLYDLQGRRLLTAPAKGVYIQAGRKVVK